MCTNSSTVGSTAKRAREDATDTEMEDGDNLNSKKSTKAGDGVAKSDSTDKDAPQTDFQNIQDGDCIVYVSHCMKPTSYSLKYF